jgi:hypothetical protein
LDLVSMMITLSQQALEALEVNNSQTFPPWVEVEVYHQKVLAKPQKSEMGKKSQKPQQQWQNLTEQRMSLKQFRRVTELERTVVNYIMNHPAWPDMLRIIDYYDHFPNNDYTNLQTFSKVLWSFVY